MSAQQIFVTSSYYFYTLTSVIITNVAEKQVAIESSISHTSSDYSKNNIKLILKGLCNNFRN